MSDLLESYKDQMPERCKECPVFLAYVGIAESSEQSGALAEDALLENMDRTDEIAAVITSVNTQLLEMATDNELQATKIVARLARNADQCPAPKRGGVPYETFLSRVMSWAANTRSCRNPGQYSTKHRN